MKTLILLLLSILLSGCSVASYTKNGVTAWGASIGGDTALGGFDYSSTGDSVNVKIDSLDSKKTQSMQNVMDMFMKAAVMAAKP
jgi:hypothetical protein